VVENSAARMALAFHAPCYVMVIATAMIIVTKNRPSVSLKEHAEQDSSVVGMVPAWEITCAVMDDEIVGMAQMRVIAPPAQSMPSAALMAIVLKEIRGVIGTGTVLMARMKIAAAVVVAVMRTSSSVQMGIALWPSTDAIIMWTVAIGRTRRVVQLRHHRQ